MAEENKSSLDALAALCKRRGFIYHSSEIYGGIPGFWDYGPLGCELKNNVKQAWWQFTVRGREDVAGLDATIIMHPKIWKASGHLDTFADPMTMCKDCKKLMRSDQIKDIYADQKKKPQPKLPGSDFFCPYCGGELTEPKPFNLMFKTIVGPIDDPSNVAYLRPETAQAIFAQFQNVLATSRQTVPFGIAQMGKSFRNEVTPRNYTFRSREFEQMEIEYFISPREDWRKLHREWIDACKAWFVSIGLPASELAEDVHPDEKLAHYAKACTDITFHFPHGLQELQGIAVRGNFDLTQHQNASGKNLEYFDETVKEKYLPHVIEPSLGVDRTLLAVLTAAYCEDEVPNDKGEAEKRVLLKFSPRVAPFKAAIFPLVKNKPELMDKAREIHAKLRRRWNVFFDAAGAIGRRYRRQDEIGTPFGITIDFQTLEDGTVTLRDRDTTKQTRMSVAEVMQQIDDVL